MKHKNLAIQFLWLDQSDSKIDYNSDNYATNNYEQEIENFLNGIKFLEEEIKKLQDNEITETKITEIVYNAAKVYDETNIKYFFTRIYQVMFNSNTGPRIPTFILLYGINNFFDKLNRSIYKPFFSI